MKTTEQIMESIQEHASTWSLAGGRFDDGTMFEQAKQQKAALRTAIEELHRDASKWHEYKARKDAVVAAGMGRRPMREKVTCDTYGVINEDGEVEYSACWPEACHDHIKDMQIEHGMGSKWKVRALKYLPVTTPRKESK